MEAPEEKKIRDMEYLILLILGKSNGKISLLHLQKIFFFLWKFHPDVRRLTNFIPHIKGPFSSGIDEIVKNPYHLSKCWLYKPPRNDVERIQGGYLIISKSGQRKYNILLRKLNKTAKKNESIAHLLAAIDLIVPLYTRLKWDELLLLLYTDETNKEFSKKSELSKEILNKSDEIINRLVKKGIIPEEKRKAMKHRIKTAKWLVS